MHVRYGTVIYDDLYVLQNQYGLIKVGRSANVEERVRFLRARERCDLAIILVRANKGPSEEWAHRRLKRHRLEGEWFHGDGAVRAAVEKLLNKGAPLAWPFTLDEDAAEAWLEQFVERRAHRYLIDRFRECLRYARDLPPGPDVDSQLWLTYWLSERGQPGPLIWGEPRDSVWHPDSGEESPLPYYSSDLQTALQLWPDDARPSSWNGSAIECCVAAMEFRLARHQAQHRDDAG